MNSVAMLEATQCTGCGLCERVCPVSAISMISDAEGFLKPDVDNDVCISCGKCLQRCAANPEVNVGACTPTSGYVAIGAEHATWRRSSSGGVAFAAGKLVLERGGLVIGCELCDDGVARHRTVCDLTGLHRLQGSKYVQSELGNIYDECKTACSEGKEVLFIGTPCQVFALKQYVGVQSGHLITMDLICHGVPSPRFWQRDLEYQQTKGKLLHTRQILFRRTDTYERISYILGDDDAKSRRECISWHDDAYYSSFMQGISYRESCYRCRFARNERSGDITIGDCATEERYLRFEHLRPISTVLVNSTAGKQLIRELNERGLLKTETLDMRLEMQKNAQLSAPAPRPAARSALYRDLDSMTYDAFTDKYSVPLDLKTKVKSLLKRMVPMPIRQEIKRSLRYK